MSEVELIDLNVNTDLINPQFDSYKIDLEKLPTKCIKLPKGVPNLQPSGAQFSYEQARIFAHAGQLYFDSWNSSKATSVFFITQDDGNIYRTEYNVQRREWSELMPVVNFNKADGQALPPSAVFPSQDIAIISNGGSNVSIYKTSNARTSFEQVFTFCPFESSGIYIQDARLVNGKLEIVVESVVDHEKTSPDDHKVFDLIVDWVTISTEPWQILRKQDVSLPGHVNFITLDENAEHIIVNSSEVPKVIADTDGLLPTEDTDESMETDPDAKKLYVWTERGDEVSIAFNLEPTVKKHEINVKSGTNDILVTVGGNIILNGQLGGHIQPESASWTLTDASKLEVTLFKRDLGVSWSFLVDGDKRGKFEQDPSLVDQATAALEKFSSESKVPGALGSTETFNREQNEECDMTEDNMSTIYWYNKEKQAITQQCDITGHQFLFETKISGLPSKICVRCDVDGMIFSLSDRKLVHEAVLAAFGYIQASKTNRRWCVSPLNHSYVALAESSNHAFIYHQTSEVKSELLNRKTKEKFATVAKQHVINLKVDSNMMDTDQNTDVNILDAHATDNVLYLLISNALYAISLE